MIRGRLVGLHSYWPGNKAQAPRDPRKTQNWSPAASDGLLPIEHAQKAGIPWPGFLSQREATVL